MESNSRKRRDETNDSGKVSSKLPREYDTGEKIDVTEDQADNGNELEFEDPFGDEFEEEDFEEDEDLINEYNPDEESLSNAGEISNNEIPDTKQVWRPGIDQLAEGEELEYDPRAYIMYHSLRDEWPCLSFDFLKDNLGEGRLRFPMTMFMVTGSQADRSDRNKITLLKLSELHKTYSGNESDEDNSDNDSDEDNIDEEPVLEHVNTPHNGGVNRVRSMPQTPGIIATLSDNGNAYIYDLSATYQSMLVKGPLVQGPSKPSFTFLGHKEEGYALDWSPVVNGRLATGDCQGLIHIWNAESATWTVDNKPYSGHRSSVEDIQWSPTEASVFISASSDKTVRVWDVRGRNGPQITVEDAHTEDVNVISWNRNVAYLLASGSDDGSFKVWDLRAIKKNETLAQFNYHKGPITSIEWAPHDESVIALSSADDQLTIWDLSVEAEDPSSGTAADPTFDDYPAQLLFIHQGQHNVKEIHHHPQIPGVIFSTAEDGFNVFKPAISVST